MNILVGIPAYNEEMTIGSIIERTHQALPDNSVVVVDDGSSDHTPEIVRESVAVLVSLPCNLGYSNAVETILRYAMKHEYDAVVLIDADGQHDPASLPGLLATYAERRCDVLIGSRYVETRNYDNSTFGRRVGMILFSWLTRWLTGKRIYDTTSGMKVIGKRAMSLLLQWQFVDFHAEAIAYLLWSGLTVEEFPITFQERQHGESMYSFFSYLWYPVMVILMITVSLIQSKMYNKKVRGL